MPQATRGDRSADQPGPRAPLSYPACADQTTISNSPRLHRSCSAVCFPGCTPAQAAATAGTWAVMVAAAGGLIWAPSWASLWPSAGNLRHGRALTGEAIRQILTRRTLATGLAAITPHDAAETARDQLRFVGGISEAAEAFDGGLWGSRIGWAWRGGAVAPSVADRGGWVGSQRRCSDGCRPGRRLRLRHGEVSAERTRHL